MYKIVFTDMDGTLLPHDKILSPYTKEVVAAVRKKGVKFVLASGRSVLSMRRYHEELGLDEPLIGYNGALVEINKEPISYQALPTTIAEDLLAFALERDLFFQYYNYNMLSSLDRYHEHENLVKYSQSNQLAYETHSSSQMDLSKVTKWMFIHHHRAELEEIVVEVRKRFGEVAAMSFTNEFFFEVYHQEINKGAAAMKVLEHYGLKQEESVSFGDNYNDLELVDFAALGVAMKNSPKELEAVAQRVSKLSCDEDGVAHILEEIFLK